MLSKYTFLLLFIFACFYSCTNTKSESETSFKGYNIVKQSIEDSAMVVSAHPLATEAGLSILKKGGNAIDAMVAVHFALAVAYPRAGNLGGGGFMVFRDKDGNSHTLDFREKAPALAHRNMYLDADSNVVDSLSRFGHLAAGVPGSVEGMFEAHQKFGKLDWSTLVQPALDLAKNGVHTTQREVDIFNFYLEDFHKYNPEPNAFVKGENWKEGDLLVQPDLEKTLTAIRDKGRAGFYEGNCADLIVKEMQKTGGIMSLEDLKNYTAVWRKPLIFAYKEYNVIGMPPPSSGGICLAELLNMTENFDMSKKGYYTKESLHLFTEAARRAYADRAEHLGDMDFYKVPLSKMVSQEYANQRMQNFDSTTATPSTSVSHGNPYPKESDQTTHYSIVDAEGNAIAVTTTINSNFGCKVIVEGAGFFLNNEMDDFSAKPGVPNQFGLLGNDANAIQPHKRMLSSMTPTIVEKDGQFFMSAGSPGGSKIITTVFQVITNVIDFDKPLKEAVHGPRFHFQWFPDTLYYEKDAFSPDLVNELKGMGHNLKSRGDIGQAEAIIRRKDGKLEGVADWRGNDSALGY